MIRILGIIASIAQVFIIPSLVEMNEPKNLVFPRPINNGMKIDKEEVSWKLVDKIKGSRKENANGKVWVYIINDKNGKVIKRIYGSDTWNVSIFYDYDNDGIDEFFVRQHDVFTGEAGSVISSYKFKENNYEFWKYLSRSDLPFYLDYKLFGAGYWMFLYFIEFICITFIVLWILSFLRKK